MDMAGRTGQSKKAMKMQTRLAITEDDAKVLGRITARRRDMAVSSQKFQTSKMKTQNSAWTPVVNKPLNEQIFKERRDLVSHWFDLWNDSQRKRFLDVIFQQCNHSQFRFVQRWFNEKVPMQHLDFTSVLPRFLSCYIFSFLEPKSLCRCAQVSWHWKFISEQETVWMGKCVRLGWFLPYTPADNEYGAWKRHYVACIHTLDHHVTKSASLDRSTGRHRARPQMPIKSGRLSRMDSRRLMDIRSPWQGPDFRPKDLINASRSLYSEQNPNEPVIPQSDLVMFNKFGARRSTPENTLATRSLDFEIGMDLFKQREKHRMLLFVQHILKAGEDYHLPKANKLTLRDQLIVTNQEEKRLHDLINTDWMPPTASMMKSFKAQSWKACSAHIGGSFTSTNPRIILISSRVPAAELLLDAVLFGVIPVVYEYEGSTAESIVQQVEEVLAGRNAQSIGLFCHCDEPSELWVAHGCTVSLVSLSGEGDSRAKNFFETLTNHILPAEMGGQFDIFVPLACSEEGMEMMVQLSVMTGIQFSSPTGLIGSYNCVNSEWLIPYENDKQPPSVYFCQSKFSTWANIAEQAQEAVKETKAFMDPYFDRLHRNICGQLTGQIVFDVLGQTDIQGVNNIVDVLKDGLKALSSSTYPQPLQFLGQYILERADVSIDAKNSAVITDVNINQQLSQSSDYMNNENGPSSGFAEEDGTNNIGEKVVNDQHIEDEERGDRAEESVENNDENLKDSRQEKNKTRVSRQESRLQTIDLSVRYGTVRSNKNQRLTSEQYSQHPEKRTPVAFEILASETEYLRILKAVQDVFVKPLKAALASNRSIISTQNIQIIFTDIMNIFKLSRELEDDLRNRLVDWDAQHTCLGDVFVRFCTKLKAYTNFTNNYEVILRAVERCKEQTPAFRAFLQRYERVPETKMLALPEIFLLPVGRISEYVHLLTWFELHTPHTHADRQDLVKAINALTELYRSMKECKVRMERERQLVSLTRKIINCPALLEANRYLVMQLDVAHLRPPSDSAVPEFRTFQEVAMLGLYLFNDALVITRRTSKHFPFSRAVEFHYKYETSMSLVRMKVVDIPNSKFVKNAFKMETPKQAWSCATVTADDKFNWISILSNTLRGSIERK